MTKAIAYVELSKTQHTSLLEDSVALSEELATRFEGVTKNELAVEIAVKHDLGSSRGTISNANTIDDQIVPSDCTVYYRPRPHANKHLPCTRYRCNSR